MRTNSYDSKITFNCFIRYSQIRSLFLWVFLRNDWRNYKIAFQPLTKLFSFNPFKFRNLLLNPLIYLSCVHFPGHHRPCFISVLFMSVNNNNISYKEYATSWINSSIILWVLFDFFSNSFDEVFDDVVSKVLFRSFYSCLSVSTTLVRM